MGESKSPLGWRRICSAGNADSPWQRILRQRQDVARCQRDLGVPAEPDQIGPASSVRGGTWGCVKMFAQLCNRAL